MLKSHNVVDKFKAIFLGGHVKRFHGKSTNRQINNAEHSWGVAVILALIMDKPSSNLLIYALVHDCPEYETGDIPSTTKRSYPKIKKLISAIEDEYFKAIDAPKITPEEYRMLKIADYIDMMQYLLAEKKSGNRNLDQIFANCESFILYFEPLPEKAKQIIKSIREQYLGV